MCICHCPDEDKEDRKKLKNPVGKQSTTGKKEALDLGDLGEVELEQMWPIQGGSAVSRKGDDSVSITAGKAVFLPPREWTQILLPYKINVKGHISVFCSLNRKGVVAGLAVTRGGQIKVNAWNATEEALYLTPKTVLVTVRGTYIVVKKLGIAERVRVNQIEVEEAMGQKIKT